MLCSFSLQLIFFSEQPFYGNYSTLDSHTNTVNLLVKMASNGDKVYREGNRHGEWIFCRRKEADVALFFQVTRMNEKDHNNLSELN